MPVQDRRADGRTNIMAIAQRFVLTKASRANKFISVVQACQPALQKQQRRQDLQRGGTKRGVDSERLHEVTESIKVGTFLRHSVFIDIVGCYTLVRLRSELENFVVGGRDSTLEGAH